MISSRFLVSLAIEFGPVVAFFAASVAYDFFVGVALLMIATVGSVAVSRLRDGRVPLFSLIMSLLVVASGAVTLLTADPFWVVIEYSVSNALFGLAMIVGYVRGTPVLKALFGTMFALTERGWNILTLRWGIFFILTVIASEAVWRLWSYDEWVYFRFVSALVMCVFGFSQFFLARRERLPEASLWGLRQ